LGTLHGPGSLPGWTFVQLDFDINGYKCKDNKWFFLSNFSLCSNQSNHRTEIDCLSFQQEIIVLISEKFSQYQ
jgi:hypothetical protein